MAGNKKICSIEEKMQKVRDLVNHPWRRAVIFSDKIKWEKACSSMDVLEDTQLAINSYFELGDSDFANDGKKYLYLYGLLQAFFLQQNASIHLYQALFGGNINWKDSYPDLYEIKELRNDAIGHPTHRKNDSFHYIARASLGKESFILSSYYPKKSDVSHKTVNLHELRQKQRNGLCIILNDIITSLEEEMQKHKDKFKGKKLIELIPDDFNYIIGKLYEGIYKDYPLVKMNFKRLREFYEKIKDEITERYHSINALSGIKEIVDDIDYILLRLDKWIEANTLRENKTAEVFLYALEKKFEEFKEMLDEIDEEFQK